MAYDIYGERLTPGHCEVHPWVAVEYPCPVCMESHGRHAQEKEMERQYNAYIEREYYQAMEQQAFEDGNYPSPT